MLNLLRGLSFTLAIQLSPVGLASGVQREEVFPIEKLPVTLQAEAKTILQRMFESEALLTIVGDLKPMSSGSWMSLRFEVDSPPIQKLEDWHLISGALSVGKEIQVVINPFTRIMDGKRHVEGYVFRRSTFDKKVKENPRIFGYFGITPSMPFASVLGIIDGESTPERSRAYGTLFGYPKHAVDFFVSAEESQKKDGNFVQRDFWTVPVYGSKNNRFVYAIPKGAAPIEIDLQIKDKVARIVSAFTFRRQKYEKDGAVDILSLARDWFRGPNGLYDPQYALY